MRKQENSSNSRIIAVFLLVSVIIVVLIVVSALVLIIASKLITPSQIDNGPYNIAARAIPKSSDLHAVFPKTVGDFTLSKNVVSGNIATATYSNGKDTLTIQCVFSVSIAAAQQRVMNLYGAVRPNYSDPLSFQSITPDGAHFAWSHDRWFFDVQTKTQQIMDSFVNKFPY
jgi:hypothetical protein